MHIDHWMTFSTFAEQRFFIYPSPDTYNGVIINANMVAHAPSGIVAFLLEKTKNLNFIIDPLTHAFQHDIRYIMSDKESNEVKSSISKLAQEYGKPFIDKVGKKPINHSDFENEDQRKKMVYGCINFQRTKLQKSKSTKEIDKYLSEKEKTLAPYALVAPYFYLTEISYEKWLYVMKKCLLDVLDIKTQEEKIFVAIVISKELLRDKNIIDSIISNFADTNIDGFLIWIDNFDEQSASIHELKQFIYLCEQLKNQSNEVINLHGGYFSSLVAGNLGGSLLSGVAHGPEFGEYRSVIPVGGGIPIAKYYIPKLYSRIKYRDAFNIFNSLNWLKDSTTFYENVCACAICKQIISNNIDQFTLFGISASKTIERKGKLISLDYPIKKTKEICLKHYLNVKKTEYSKVVTLDKQQLLSDLENNQNIFEQVVGIDFVGYLEKWRKAFTS